METRFLVFECDAVYNYVMGKDQQIATWVFMIMTAFRKRCGLSQSDFVPMAKRYGLVGFLMEHYELLHYYDNEYIVNDVLRYISEQGGSSSGLLGTV